MAAANVAVHTRSDSAIGAKLNIAAAPVPPAGDANSERQHQLRRKPARELRAWIAIGLGSMAATYVGVYAGGNPVFSAGANAGACQDACDGNTVFQRQRCNGKEPACEFGAPIKLGHGSVAATNVGVYTGNNTTLDTDSNIAADHDSCARDGSALIQQPD